MLTASGVDKAVNASDYGWRYLFQGGRFDAVTGLYKFGYRDYDPTQGRWIERDPLGLAAGDNNIYRFVGNNPVDRTDPTGLIDGWDILTCVGGGSQLGAGLVEGAIGFGLAISPEPLLTKAGGGFLLFNGADNARAGYNRARYGSSSPTVTAQALSQLAQQAGHSKKDADLLGEMGNAVIGTGGTIAGRSVLRRPNATCPNSPVPNIPPLGRLRSSGPGSWDSSGGLRYTGTDRDNLNRVQHVLKHADDVPNRPGAYGHGGFDSGRTGALRDIDEAWGRVQQGGPNVTATSQGNRMKYEIDMGRRVGYVGGQAGGAAGNPAANSIRLIVETVTRSSQPSRSNPNKSSTMFYATSVCPACSGGVVGFRKCSDGQTLVLVCDECDAVWRNPDRITVDTAFFPSSPDHRIEGLDCSIATKYGSCWATSEEIKTARMEFFVVGEA